MILASSRKLELSSSETARGEWREEKDALSPTLMAMSWLRPLTSDVTTAPTKLHGYVKRTCNNKVLLTIQCPWENGQGGDLLARFVCTSCLESKSDTNATIMTAEISKACTKLIRKYKQNTSKL